MERIYLDGPVILDPEFDTPLADSILVEGDRIGARFPQGTEPSGDFQRIDLAGHFLAPGLIDLHYHGELIFLEASDYDAALDTASAAILRHGTTAFLPTTVAWHPFDLLERVGVLAEIVGRGGAPGAEPLGLHLEGPWICAAAAGAQPGAAIRPPASREVAEVLARGEGSIRMVTFAPEIEGSVELQAELARRGVVGALGHSHADTVAVTSAVERGASHVTHLFNAMGPLHHRAPGLVGVALADERLTCDLICDGVHLHPTAVQLAARALEDRLVLITDRIELPAADRGPKAGRASTSSFGSGTVHADGVAIRFADGALAGSSVTLDLALRNFRDFSGASLLDAVKACTLRPARALGIEAERGTLRCGARADFAVLDEAGHVIETWVGGRRLYRAYA